MFSLFMDAARHPEMQRVTKCHANLQKSCEQILKCLSRNDKFDIEEMKRQM